VREDLTASKLETLVCFLSREFQDGERVTVGAANLTIPAYAALLAHLHHGPNMRLFIAASLSHLLKEPRVSIWPTAMDYRGTRWAEAFLRHDETLIQIPFLTASFFIGALQVDPYGNTNLIGRRQGEGGRLAMRGPGALATSTMADHVPRFFIYLTRHTPEVFVECCDYVSCIGWGYPEGPTRQELGLPGGGPKYCLSPLAVLDFEEKCHRMRLRHVLPGVHPQEVIRNTGFELVIPTDVPEIEAPTPEELWLLRTRVDPAGALRR